MYGNKESMNLNSMILTNILGSPYFKEELINYKTFHEVVDEIYYKVSYHSFANLCLSLFPFRFIGGPSGTMGEEQQKAGWPSGHVCWGE